MKTNYLLPNKYKTLGWVLLIFGVITGLLFTTNGYQNDTFNISVLQMFNSDINFKGKRECFFQITENNILDEIISLFIIIGGLLVGFTKEKIEDEFIYKLRKDSLVWAIIVNYTILLLSIIFIFEGNFLDVMIYNMFTPLIFFIIRFNFLKFKSARDEE